MKPYLFIILLAGLSSKLIGQVGINNNSPAGVFHVNATANDVNNVSPNDDFIIANTTGNVGIGLIAPTVKLDIRTQGTLSAPISGFRLVDGTQAVNKVLYSNANGLSSWQKLAVFDADRIQGTFTFDSGTAIGNINWNSIANLVVPPGTSMVYMKLHVLSTVSQSYVRAYTGTKNNSTDNANVAETPVFGSAIFQSFPGKDFEIDRSFIYNNATGANQTLYFNFQSDSSVAQRSQYIGTNAATFRGAALTENYFFAIPSTK